MVSVEELITLVKKARENSKKRNFLQAVELIITLKDIDLKKGFSLNEIVNLPYPPTKRASICLIASGDLALRAKNANIDRVIEPDELVKIGNNKREAKKLAKSYEIFLAETSAMTIVGKVLGQYLGPRGKMAIPLPFNAPIESMVGRLRSSIRVRLRRQLMIGTKVGYEDMKDEQLAENMLTVLNLVETKLPNGEKNIRDIIVKFTMGRPVKLSSIIKAVV